MSNWHRPCFEALQGKFLEISGHLKHLRWAGAFDPNPVNSSATAYTIARFVQQTEAAIDIGSQDATWVVRIFPWHDSPDRPARFLVRPSRWESTTLRNLVHTYVTNLMTAAGSLLTPEIIGAAL